MAKSKEEEKSYSENTHKLSPLTDANDDTNSYVKRHAVNGGQTETATEPRTSRRFSLGDSPPHLSASEDFLIGRAMFRKTTSTGVLVTEIVPSNWTIQGSSKYTHGLDGMANGQIFIKWNDLAHGVDGNDEWKIPIELFSAKKQPNGNSRQKQSKRIRAYYKAQDKLINAYEDIEKGAATKKEVVLQEDNAMETYYRQGLFYSRVTLLINLCLLLAKLVASILSGSMAVISSVVDSCLDLFSGAIMWWASKAVKSRSLYTYPQGRTKLEPVAIIILSVVMALSSMQIIRESVEKIVKLANESVSLPDVDVVVFCIMGATILVKLVLFLVCRRVNSLIVQALAMDHRNDVVSNSVAVIFGYLGSTNFFAHTGSYECSYLDPAGAILISLYIIYNWWRTGSEQIKMLTGHTARPHFLSQLTWAALNHHPDIQHVDTVRAFHFGSHFLVEVDIVLGSDMPLKKAHDIGESLQHRLESLPDVERAFVHLDYEFTHHPHSEHKVV